MSLSCRWFSTSPLHVSHRRRASLAAGMVSAGASPPRGSCDAAARRSSSAIPSVPPPAPASGWALSPSTAAAAARRRWSAIRHFCRCDLRCARLSSGGPSPAWRMAVRICCGAALCSPPSDATAASKAPASSGVQRSLGLLGRRGAPGPPGASLSLSSTAAGPRRSRRAQRVASAVAGATPKLSPATVTPAASAAASAAVNAAESAAARCAFRGCAERREAASRTTHAAQQAQGTHLGERLSVARLSQGARRGELCTARACHAASAQALPLRAARRTRLGKKPAGFARLSGLAQPRPPGAPRCRARQLTLIRQDQFARRRRSERRSAPLPLCSGPTRQDVAAPLRAAAAAPQRRRAAKRPRRALCAA